MLQTVYRRTVPWLTDTRRAADPDNPLRARPYISAIQEDEAGQLWVMTLILSDNDPSAAQFQKKSKPSQRLVT